MPPFITNLPVVKTYQDFKQQLQLLQKFEIVFTDTSFAKLPRPVDSKETFRSSSQAATSPLVYYTRKGFTFSADYERPAGKLWV